MGLGTNSTTSEDYVQINRSGPIFICHWWTKMGFQKHEIYPPFWILKTLYPPKGRVERTLKSPLDILSILLCDYETKIEL